MGAIVSELLAQALASRKSSQPPPELHWFSQAMNARVDLDDKDAVYAVLDADRG